VHSFHPTKHFEIRIADTGKTILFHFLNERGCDEAYRLLVDCFCRDKRVHQLILNDVDLNSYPSEM